MTANFCGDVIMLESFKRFRSNLFFALVSSLSWLGTSGLGGLDG